MNPDHVAGTHTPGIIVVTAGGARLEDDDCLEDGPPTP